MENQESLDAILERIRSRFQVEFRPLTIDGTTFEILDVANMRQVIDRLIGANAIRDPLRDLPLWAKVWPGTFVMEMFLRRRVETEGKRFLELGCGCGVLGVIASRLGFSRMVVSDVEEDALLFARANVLRNGLEGRVEVTGVDVTRPGSDPRFAGGVDIVAASEILYLDALHRPLLNFLGRHLARGGRAVFCTDMARRKPRFAKIAAKEFTVSEIFAPGTMTGADGTPSKRLYSLLTLEKK